MKLLSIDHVPGQQIEALGMVKGAVVQTKQPWCRPSTSARTLWLP